MGTIKGRPNKKKSLFTTKKDPWKIAAFKTRILIIESLRRQLLTAREEVGTYYREQYNLDSESYLQCGELESSLFVGIRQLFLRYLLTVYSDNISLKGGKMTPEKQLT